ncbi:hypothetical protein ALC53_00872 [Atta colombica]|uniref:Uncharacterized protein n=1 Tax=Atta colombica TaxID=520822 RepID=A0A195BV08_9HYME|nr:hypothetical protein ALC53_00872 [Atta colombica]
MHFATLGHYLDPQEVRRMSKSSCLEITAKFRVKLDDKIKRALSSFFANRVRVLRESSSIFESRLRKAGVVEEFQVGDTCKASVVQKQLREVILLRGTMQFWLIPFPTKFRKLRWRKLRRFKSMGSYDFLWKCRIISE